jgi:ribosome maturation factor RimP
LLKKESDFVRFTGEMAQIKLRMPLAGRKNFAGVIRGVNDGMLQMEVEGSVVALELSNVDKARLVPVF